MTNQAIEEGVSLKLSVEPFTVWVPVPLYKYDLNYIPFRMIDVIRRQRYGYPIMAEYIRQHDMGNSFLSCANIQEGLHEQLYVDLGHYNPTGNLVVARCAVDGLVRSGALDRAWHRKTEHRETPRQILEDIASQSGGSAQLASPADRSAASTPQTSR